MRRLYGSDDLFPDRIEEARRPFYSINYIIAHDGLTLYDLVSYNKRRNEANGHQKTPTVLPTTIAGTVDTKGHIGVTPM